MCIGKVIEVWHSNEWITAYKIRMNYGWSQTLYVGKVYYARPRIVSAGGGYGFVRFNSDGDQIYPATRFLNKSVKYYLLGNRVRLEETAQLSGFHAYEDYQKALNHALAGCQWKPCDPVYEVELSGLMQRSSAGELMGSEMRVIRVMDEPR